MKLPTHCHQTQLRHIFCRPYCVFIYLVRTSSTYNVNQNCKINSVSNWFIVLDGEAGGMLPPDGFAGSLVNTLDFDFNATTAHLEVARHFPDHLEIFKRNSRTVVQEMSSLGPVFDPKLLELFKTEFQIIFLWGERGSMNTPTQRFVRLTDILTNMANKLATQSPELEDGGRV